MLILLSPAKTLDFESSGKTAVHSLPDLIQDSQLLVEELKRLSASELSSLMKISKPLGELNFKRYTNWHLPFTIKNAKQALFAFKGDVYEGVNTDDFSEEDLCFAQEHLRILSGLYGLLKPTDLIQPYRLEMGTRLITSRGRNLYEFWGNKITELVNQELSNLNSNYLINLASNEYYKVLNVDSLKAQIITPIFKDWKNGEYKLISFYAKKSRGMMCNYIIKNQIKSVEDIKNFDLGGYLYNPDLSTEHQWIFTRKT